MGSDGGLNAVRLVDPGTGAAGHFKLSEFVRARQFRGAVNVTTLWSLERTRAELNRRHSSYYGTIGIVVTDPSRNYAELRELASRHGWTDDDPPGLVSRDSQHLIVNGATGVDFYAVALESRQGDPALPMELTYACASDYFDFCLGYRAHVHGDNRSGCRAWTRP